MTPASFRKLHDAERARAAKADPKVSRAAGACSCCGRGRDRAVTLVKLEPEESSAKFRGLAKVHGWRVFPGRWLGLCLRCAGLVAGAVGR